MEVGIVTPNGITRLEGMRAVTIRIYTRFQKQTLLNGFPFVDGNGKDVPVSRFGQLNMASPLSSCSPAGSLKSLYNHFRLEVMNALHLPGTFLLFRS